MWSLLLEPVHLVVWHPFEFVTRTHRLTGWGSSGSWRFLTVYGNGTQTGLTTAYGGDGWRTVDVPGILAKLKGMGGSAAARSWKRSGPPGISNTM